ncbi:MULTISPECIES: DNA/RNA non-specific endonuclease [unclassified Microbacterium]|uniref:DNA/RNA non-specific endonuclease n=1 Tax=unclassified Microbacterium TaxID=2609290 RepID=UPI00214BDC15|nr:MULTISPECIES: DNA/RNA non-specific endonuclease [unclassified Microbacterium]MCR2800569.1 DNA/RNA non-specific endonuclease [Microbacterium sp. zg.Y818]MCR2824682.1 DNA/RNA non-specific endonuclease [Microbacterium sp. zg.Y909]WIM23298.1 DNA/RNA non-specific endonuclease [Microbacterium sp. zg-Y818]
MADGYDPLFLDADVPLPTSRRQVVRLDYPRFTVVLDIERRLAAVTAVNIDGASLRDLPRTGEWQLDPRVPADQQAGPEVYAGNNLDRGHLVRRRDPGWGETQAAREATEATFRYPNAAPQAAGFNQSKQLWLGLEDHVLGYAEATDQRLSVFTAPVLRADDPPYRGIRIPLRFWKVAAWHSTDGLAATAFVLDQSELVDIREGAVVAPPLAAFRTFQMPVAEVVAATGIDLGPLIDADVLPVTEGVTTWRELDTTEDIVL